MAGDFDTRSMAPEDRGEYIREMARLREGRIEVDFGDDPEALCGVLTDRTFGAVTLSTSRWSSLTIQRKVSAAQENVEQSVVLTVQLAGTTVVTQEDREALVRPGELTVHDNSQPFVVASPEAVDQITVRVPRSTLALPSSVLTAASARTIGPDRPTAQVAGTYFRMLSESAPDHTPESALPGPSSIELVRAVVASSQDRSDLAADPLHHTLQQRVMTYLRVHLADADLSAARIADAHHISVRQLYLVLSRAGVSLGDWIRAQRLEESREELASPRRRHATIESVARGWGFASAAHFSRAFKQAYGMSPRQWRLESLAAAEPAELPLKAAR